MFALLLLAPASTTWAQDQLPAGQTETEKPSKRGDVLSDAPDTATQLTQLRHALVRLPIAAGLACILAMRPRRRGTPSRQPAVVQTQIILAIVGAVVMLVVGSSLARAFGIVGAAGLVRYRAKIEDPKDAGVMLSTLAVGLAAGVGVWVLAAFTTGFFLLVLWIVESFEPKPKQLFALKVKAKDPAALKTRLEQLLTSTEELHYEVRIPFDRKADGLTDAIVALDRDNASAADLEEKKDKK
jgi:uncharacterized membrane protein YhiD involved in acid resistance